MSYFSDLDLVRQEIAKHTPEQRFEERIDRLKTEIGDLVEFAKKNPAVVAAQDLRTMEFLSVLRQLSEQPQQKLRVVGQ